MEKIELVDALSELNVARHGDLPMVDIVEAAGPALSLTIDVKSRVTAYDITLTAPVCVLTLDLPEVVASYIASVSMTFRQGTGANKVDWPPNVVWQYNRQPVLAYVANAGDMVTLVSDPVTKRWRGMVDGGWFNV